MAYQNGAPTLVLLWDIDKTLLVNHSGVDLFAATVLELGGRLPDGWNLVFDGMTDIAILRRYLEAAGVGDIDEGRAAACFELLSERLYTGPGADMRPIDGVQDALLACRECGWVNAVFTGNTPARGPLKLRAAGFDLERCFGGFAHGEGFFEGYRASRLDGADDVRRAWPDSPVVVVGDAPLDYELALALGCRFWQVGHAAIATSPDVALGGADDFVGAHLKAFLAAVGSCARR